MLIYHNYIGYNIYKVNINIIILHITANGKKRTVFCLIICRKAGKFSIAIFEQPINIQFMFFTLNSSINNFIVKFLQLANCIHFYKHSILDEMYCLIQ